MFKSAIFGSPYFPKGEGVAAELEVARTSPAFSGLVFAVALFILVFAITGTSLVPANLWHCSVDCSRTPAGMTKPILFQFVFLVL